MDTSIGYLNTAIGQLEELQKNTEDTTTQQTCGVLMKEISASIQYQQGVKQALTGTLQAGITSIKQGAALIDTYAGKIADGSVKLVKGAAKLEAGAKAIQTGVDTMVSGNNGQNLNTMIAGLSMLSQQSGKLVAGTQKLADGSGKLLAGTDALTDGTSTLSNGAGKLADGTGDLADGTDKLISGIGELLDGSKDLAEGMAKFDEEGIQKLTSLTDGDLGDIVDRWKRCRLRQGIQVLRRLPRWLGVQHQAHLQDRFHRGMIQYNTGRANRFRFALFQFLNTVGICGWYHQNWQKNIVYLSNSMEAVDLKNVLCYNAMTI